MIELCLVGMGAGNPDHITRQGVAALTYGFRETRPPADYANGESKTFSQVNGEQRAATLKATAPAIPVIRSRMSR